MIRKGISTWAFPEGVSLEAQFQKAKDAGFEGIEVAMSEKGEITPSSIKEEIDIIISKAEKIGIEIVSLATELLWGDYSLTSSNESTRKKAEEIAFSMVEVASFLGVQNILFIPGAVSEVEDCGFVYDRALNFLKRLAPEAEKKNICIGVENVWNKLLYGPFELRDFIDKVGSKSVGIYFDVGNVIPFGYPEQWIRLLGKRIVQIHFKDFRRASGNINGFVDLLSGDVNYPEVINALNAIGYNGWCIAEVFPYSHHPEAVLYTTSKAMDFILRKI